MRLGLRDMVFLQKKQRIFKSGIAISCVAASGDILRGKEKHFGDCIIKMKATLLGPSFIEEDGEWHTLHSFNIAYRLQRADVVLDPHHFLGSEWINEMEGYVAWFYPEQTEISIGCEVARIRAGALETLAVDTHQFKAYKPFELTITLIDKEQRLVLVQDHRKVIDLQVFDGAFQFGFIGFYTPLNVFIMIDEFKVEEP